MIMFEEITGCLSMFACAVVIYKLLDRIVRLPRLTTSTKRSIVITGCDSGFGYAFAKRMDREGFQVFACCLTEAGRASLDSETSNRVKPFIMDVSSAESIEKGFRFVSFCLLSNEGIWALVNNAGIVGRSGPAEWLVEQDYQEVLSVNLFGMINVCNAFIPLIRKCKGRIVNTTSIIGRFAMPGSGPYVVSKFAAEGFSDVLRYDVKSFGISVHIIEPGFFRTPISNAEQILQKFSTTWKRTSAELKETYGGEEYFKKQSKMVGDGLAMCATSLLPVINSYEHAVTAVFPRGRYMPGSSAWLIVWPLSLLPEWVPTLIF